MVIGTKRNHTEIMASVDGESKLVESDTMQAIIALNGDCELVSRPIPVPGMKQVLIKIHATALNRADTLQRKGKYNPPAGSTDILGLECAGEIVALGEGCERGFSAGNAVMALLPGGGYAEYVAVNERHVMSIPESCQDWDKAAAIPETWLTAFQLLHTIGEVSPADTVLVHAIGSGVGIAATQLATKAGARVIGTAGSDLKLDTAKRFGAVAGVNYKNGPWAAGVADAAGPGGVSLVLDCVGSSYWEQNVQVLGVDGRWVVYGLMGGASVDGTILAALLRKRLRMQGTTLRPRSDGYKATLIKRFSEEALPHFDSGEFIPVIDRKFTLAEAQEAHQYMESNASNGKILLLVSEEARALA